MVHRLKHVNIKIIIENLLFLIFCIFFLFPQNDQSTEDLHIVGAEDLSLLAGKVIFLSSTTEISPTFNKELHLLQRNVILNSIAIKQTQSRDMGDGGH